jgi:hypothetical protein
MRDLQIRKPNNYTELGRAVKDYKKPPTDISGGI